MSQNMCFCAIFFGLNIHLCYYIRFFHLCHQEPIISFPFPNYVHCSLWHGILILTQPNWVFLLHPLGSFVMLFFWQKCTYLSFSDQTLFYGSILALRSFIFGRNLILATNIIPLWRREKNIIMLLRVRNENLTLLETHLIATLATDHRWQGWAKEPFKCSQCIKAYKLNKSQTKHFRNHLT